MENLPEGAIPGSPVSAGVVEGLARIVMDPAAETLNPGEILVAPSTDPAWTPLFINAAGVVLEVGGWEVIKRYVEANFGLSIVTSICLREEDRLIARNMSNYFPKRTYGVVARRGRHLPLPARAFLETVQDVPISDSPWHTGESMR